ncbi:hypothetical protein K488DRAFT_68940 [Vararia minispora EC-137]|uniref:Uncharacterized protein n=1 Tax=Vararia minispora EC-137 TaxID=1314806 RepID=A0ACB8QSG3_9AGAM|nr:hypothetical protein K488DRAFT_68940 [Vararia minispora EC-137]
MSRPRESLLNLFDPLANTDSELSPSTTTSRDSSDLSSSDKENSMPPGLQTISSNPSLTMTKFFNRIYRCDQNVPRPLPKGVLIDFDPSATIDAEAFTSDEEVGLEMEGIISERTDPESYLLKQSHATPRRRVLVDILAEDGASPYGLLDATPLGFKESLQPESLFSAPEFSSVSPSLHAPMLHDPPSPLEPFTTRSPPSITVLPPAPSSTPTDLALSSLSHNPNHHGPRESIDLQASFSMHLGDTSFDLLNDRISFTAYDTMIGSELSSEDIDVNPKLAVPASTASLSSDDVRASAEDESDKDGLADVESDSDVDFVEALSDRLADVFIDADGEAENKSPTGQPNISTPILTTPMPRPITGLVPRAPHANKFYTGTQAESGRAPAVSMTDALVRAQGRFPSSASVLTPAAPIAALRIVKKTKSTLHANFSSVSASVSAKTTSSDTMPLTPTTSRIPSPIDATVSSRVVNTERAINATSFLKTGPPEPVVRPSTVALLKYGPQGRKAQVPSAKSGGVGGRTSASTVSRLASSAAVRPQLRTETTVVPVAMTEFSSLALFRTSPASFHPYPRKHNTCYSGLE